MKTIVVKTLSSDVDKKKKKIHYLQQSVSVVAFSTVLFVGRAIVSRITAALSFGVHDERGLSHKQNVWCCYTKSGILCAGERNNPRGARYPRDQTFLTVHTRARLPSYRIKSDKSVCAKSLRRRRYLMQYYLSRSFAQPFRARGTQLYTVKSYIWTRLARREFIISVLPT